ncbi:Glycosyl transferase CAP10 domain [Dillenia turbinata]|uniref:Glycosyl transferase CAP10 domain n=1 Tax=Dillenia turbinata TaxID=194707 RepID=A0AAN8UUN2_9MAGN
MDMTLEENDKHEDEEVRGFVWHGTLKKELYTTVFLFFIILSIGAFISSQQNNSVSTTYTFISFSLAKGVEGYTTFAWSIISGASFQRGIFPHGRSPNKPQKQIEYPLNCTAWNMSKPCPNNYPTKFKTKKSTAKCPDYFRWIHVDLKPWKKTGITRDMVERGKNAASIRIVIVKGKLYTEKYKGVYQTRDVFTIWGILQLMRMYPGKLPDLDMMFECNDVPVISASNYQGTNATSPPALFHYCGDDKTLDIVFPDWSFWGWPEINIKPWDPLREDLKEGNNMSKWMDREPYAYWKGNTRMGNRKQLMWCNPNDKEDWNARIFHHNWHDEERKGFRNSNLARQCNYRYKIYAEGIAWSVSSKYILACDSVALFIKPRFYDFFTRGLVPLKHYWPINENDKCRSIKFAVNWGNNHSKKAQEIGKMGSKFIEESLTMNFVYDYMFHLLYRYAKLLKYKPRVPPNAVEVCSESVACTSQGLEQHFKMETAVKRPALSSPCVMPKPFKPKELKAFLKKKEAIIKQVETLEEIGNVEKEFQLGKN